MVLVVTVGQVRAWPPYARFNPCDIQRASLLCETCLSTSKAQVYGGDHDEDRAGRTLCGTLDGGRSGMGDLSMRLRRSELATPASNDWMFEKAAACGADLVWLDLEDGVAPEMKEVARSKAIEGLRDLNWGHTVRAVRINSLDSPWAHDDIVDIVTGARDALDTVLVPKVASDREVWWVDVLLTQLETKLSLSKQVRLEAVVETVEGLVNVDAIARSSSRLDALIFGSGDYSVSQGSRVNTRLEPVDHYPGDIWHYARSKILVAARLANLEAIDSTIANYRDIEAYEHSARQGAVLGYTGKCAIHPDQVVVANNVFTPTVDEVVQARRNLEAYAHGKRQGLGAVGLDGTLVDAIHVRRAKEVLARADLAGQV